MGNRWGPGQRGPEQRRSEQTGPKQRGPEQRGPVGSAPDNPFRAQGLRAGFVESDEQGILSWSGTLFLGPSWDNVSRPTCVLTNKRVYFTGKVYTTSQTMKQKMIIDLKDINGVGFSWISFSLLYKVLSLVFMILAAITAVAFGMYGHGLQREISAPISVAVVSLILFILFCVIKRKALIESQNMQQNGD